MSAVLRGVRGVTRLLLVTALVTTALMVVLGSSALAPPAAPARAASSFVRDLGSVTGTTSPLSLVTTATAQAGDTVVIAVANGNTVTPTCSDPINGAYTVSGANSSQFRTALCWVRLTQALPAGTTITIASSASIGNLAIAMEFSGLALANPVDKTANTGASVIGSSTGTVGPVATTSQSRELLVASFYYNLGASTMTPGTNGTANLCEETGTSIYAGGVEAIETIRLRPIYCTVNATGAYSASASDMNGAHNAAFVTFRLVEPPSITTTGAALNYTTNATSVAVDSALTVADADSANLSGASASVTSGFVPSTDTLAFTNQNGITGTYNAGSGVLTLAGSATVAAYQAALRSVTYANTSEGQSTGPRTVSFQVTDDIANVSSIATRQITIGVPTSTPTATTAPTGTTTSTAIPTVTPTVTGTLPPTSTATVTPTVTVTVTPVPLAQTVRQSEDDTDKHRSLSERERREQQHTNQGGGDDVHTEGQVVGVERSADGTSLLVTIALGPGGSERITIQVPCANGQCPDVRDGDTVEADGYQNGVGDPNTYFVASDSFEVTRDGRKVK